ncbi:hypothetical protein [Paraburkholderia nodosa]|uniref:hypothetical protein n=1 Tax=Paraburkholderia nodosa TaxID=392320 RepID=UPI000841E7E6|nr:hypothetical protein [Paraburkholderia nodosa]
MLYLHIPVGTLLDALAPGALWPVLAGAALAIGWDRWRRKVPRAPVGDVGVILRELQRGAAAVARFAQCADTFVREWSVSCLTLLLVALLSGCCRATRGLWDAKTKQKVGSSQIHQLVLHIDLFLQRMPEQILLR